MKITFKVVLCALLLAGTPTLANAGNSFRTLVLDAAVKGGQAKACGQNTKALLNALQQAMFHHQMNSPSAHHRMRTTFDYAFNLGVQRELKRGKSDCGQAKQLLQSAIQELGAS